MIPPPSPSPETHEALIAKAKKLLSAQRDFCALWAEDEQSQAGDVIEGLLAAISRPSAVTTLEVQEQEERVDGERRAAGPTGSTAASNEAAPCVIGEPCHRHGFVHGAEAEELRQRLEVLKSAKVLRILDDVDARDSLAYAEAIQRHQRQELICEDGRPCEIRHTCTSLGRCEGSHWAAAAAQPAPEPAPAPVDTCPSVVHEGATVNTCINCGTSDDGGFGAFDDHITAVSVGPFCSICWAELQEVIIREHAAPADQGEA